MVGLCTKLLQSCPILCDPMDCSPPGSSVHGILQARILEWVAFPRDLPDPGIEPRLPHCRKILYCPSLDHMAIVCSSFSGIAIQFSIVATLIYIPTNSVWWRRKWQPTPIFLPGEFQEQRSLEGYNPLCHKELDTNEWVTLSSMFWERCRFRKYQRLP